MDERCGFLGAKLHKTSMFGEVNFVEVGLKVHDFLKEHPLIQGIYLNKGKRAIKKNYVTLCRQKSVKDSGRLTWKRGTQEQGRNSVDDYFEYTEEGRTRKSKIDRKSVRDEYVVSWYMWCPGHGNCIRKCGGRGKCIPGCPGMEHKQDRHNCKVMLIFKLYLSDLTKWRVQITGLHVPKGSVWCPPKSEERSFNADTRTEEQREFRQAWHQNRTDTDQPAQQAGAGLLLQPSYLCVPSNGQQTEINVVDIKLQTAHTSSLGNGNRDNDDSMAEFPESSTPSLIFSPSLLSEPITDAEANLKIIEWISEAAGSDAAIPRLPAFDL